MTDYPKQFEKNGKSKTASNVRQEVELKFAGYRLVEASEPVESVETGENPQGDRAPGREERTEAEADRQAALARAEANTAPNKAPAPKPADPKN